MNTKTMLILGVVAVGAYLLLVRKPAAKTNTQSPPGNGLIASSIGAGTKILGAILQTGGGGGAKGSSGANVGGGGMVTSAAQLGIPDPGSDAGIITTLDD